MKRYKQLIERSGRFYTGKPLETGGTSIAGSVAPSVKWLYDKGFIREGMTVIDYGAGKYGRNADFFKNLGITTYAYDPFNGISGDGYEIGIVSDKLPREKFDSCYTSYVLNVVPEYIEDNIIKECSRLGKEVFHITRNMDIFDTVKRALLRGDKLVTDFYYKEFEGSGEFSDEDIMDFCTFGVQTSRGFQRIPFLEDKGFKLLRSTGGFKIYKK